MRRAKKKIITLFLAFTFMLNLLPWEMLATTSTVASAADVVNADGSITKTATKTYRTCSGGYTTTCSGGSSSTCSGPFSASCSGGTRSSCSGGTSTTCPGGSSWTCTSGKAGYRCYYPSDGSPCPHGYRGGTGSTSHLVPDSPCSHGKTSSHTVTTPCSHGKTSSHTVTTPCSHGKTSAHYYNENPCEHGKYGSHTYSITCSHGKSSSHTVSNPCSHGYTSSHSVDHNCSHGYWSSHSVHNGYKNAEYGYSTTSTSSSYSTFKVWPLTVTSKYGLRSQIQVTGATATDAAISGKSVKITITGLPADTEIQIDNDGTSEHKVMNLGASGSTYTFTMPAKVTDIVIKPTNTVSSPPITYGQKLGDSPLSDTNPPDGAEGIWKWDTPDIMPNVSDSNSTMYDISFYPTGSDVATATQQQMIEVHKFNPPLTVLDINYSELTYGQTLADTGLTGNLPLLNGVEVPGTFAWETPDLIPEVGSAEHNVKFTPNDTDNIETVVMAAAVTVNKIPVVITEEMRATIEASPIVYEQALADSTITGTVPVPGHYQWVDSTIKPTVADSNVTLYDVQFIPDDSHYETVDLALTLEVSKKAYTFSTSDIASITVGSLIYGDTLADSAITGPTPVEGSYRWQTPDIAPNVTDTNIYMVEFVPTDLDNYEIVEVGNIAVVVNKADPVITAEQLQALAVSEITYGQTLNDSVITAESVTPGTFSWKDPAIMPTVADSITTIYIIVFTPDDADNYNTREIEAKVKVNPAPITISEDVIATVTATDITYEQTLADSVISGSFPMVGSVTLTGSYTWKDPAIVPTVADSNVTPFEVVFTPDDINYAPAEFTLTLKVNKKTISFTPEQLDLVSPEEITYGDPIGSAPITGPLPIPGHYEWVDPTVVPSVTGTNDFPVKFIPDDTDNYEEVVIGDYHIVVNKADPTITPEQLAAITVSEITYGQALADSTISASSTTPGTFTWADDTIQPSCLDSERTEYEIIFTPTDTDNYNTIAIPKTIKVNKAVPVVPTDIATSIAATPIKFGQALADSSISYTGTGSFTGSFIWTDSTIVPIMADSDTTVYNVTYLPADQDNFLTLEYSTTVHVDKGPAPVELKDAEIITATWFGNAGSFNTENIINLEEWEVSSIVNEDTLGVFAEEPVLSGKVVSYKVGTDQAITDQVGTIKVTITSRDYEDFDIYLKVKATYCPHNDIEYSVGHSRSTCTEQGYSGNNVCKSCGCVVKWGRWLPLAEHWETTDNDVKPTCTSEGYSGDIYCFICKQPLADGQVLEKLPHTEGVPFVDIEATEHSSGIQSYYCTECGAFIRSEVIPPLEPVEPDEPDESKDNEHQHTWEAGWQFDDINHWRDCVTCLEHEEAAHGYDEGEFITATCLTEGDVKYTCTTCGLEIIKTEIPGHRYIWEPTDNGHLKKCKICGEVYGTSQHKYEQWVEIKAPTQAMMGVYQRKCAMCNYVEEIEAPVNPNINNPNTGIDLWTIRMICLLAAACLARALSSKCQI